MFETLQYTTLQQYWWVLVAILWAALIFMMFVQGGQVIYNILGKTPKEKDLVLNAIWKHYKLTFSVFVVFGWAVFASFPAFYATSFGWAYFVWMAILFLMIIQAVSYEYRKKPHNFLWQKTYDVFLFLNWLLVPLLLWVAVATFFTWSNFIIETSNLVNSAWNNIHISSWTTPFYGLEALWNTNQLAFITNISLWLAVAFLVQILALLYVMSYSIARIIAENFRQPDIQLGFICCGWMTMGQSLSLIMIFVSLMVYVYLQKLHHRRPVWTIRIWLACMPRLFLWLCWQ